jgi:non-heme chloroperoxidase
MDVEISEGLHLHVRTFGRGTRPVVLVHGWALSGRLWDQVARRWPDGAGTLHVPDLRGAGWSAKPRTGYTLERYARDVIEALEKLGLLDVALVGHSMGGAIAQLVAIERPALLAKLVLVSPVPASGVPLPPEGVQFFRAGAGRRAGTEQILRSSMAVKVSQDVMDELLVDAATVATEAYLEALEAWRNASFADRLGAIKTPTVVLGGDAEPYMPPAFLNDAVVSKIPGARFVPIPGAGHYPQVETPEALANALANAVAAG